jgi:tRNA pseudouridine55 synthase
VHGLCVIDKEVGWTSHDVVAKARGILGTRKVGHSGTLDPPATGVLVLGVGRATRLLSFVTEQPKTYVGEIVLGIETDTLDDTGVVTAQHDMGDVTLADVTAAAGRLTGPIEQIPPMVSAVKVDGTRLHQLAREGKEVERKPRPVTIHRFDVEAGDEPGTYRCHVECSSGTYVRTLAADVGVLLGGGAHLRRLRRTAVGPFTLEAATPVDSPTILPMVSVFAGQPLLTVTGDLATAVGHGKVLERNTLGVDADAEGPLPVVDADGALIAVYQAHRGSTLKPSVVLIG